MEHSANLSFTATGNGIAFGSPQLILAYNYVDEFVDIVGGSGRGRLRLGMSYVFEADGSKTNTDGAVIVNWDGGQQSRVTPGTLLAEIPFTFGTPVRFQWQLISNTTSVQADYGNGDSAAATFSSRAEILFAEVIGEDGRVMPHVSVTGDGVAYPRGDGAEFPLGTPPTLDIIDPVTDALIEDPSGHVWLDPRLERLRASTTERVGVAVDGVSALLVRSKSELPVTFSLKLNSGAPAGPEAGRLYDLAGNPLGSSAVITPSGGYAFAAYRAPPGLPQPVADPITPADLKQFVTIEASSTAGGTSRDVALVPPPVILVHGVWSNGADAWNTLARSLRAQGFTVFIADYKADSTASFNPDTASLSIDALSTTTQLALSDYRSRGLAVAQVDIVAHSLGGLVARARVASTVTTPAYRRLSNFNQGEFRKIVTVGTPHQGTPFANWLIQHRCDTMDLFLVQHNVETFFRDVLKRPFGPAVFGFRTGSDDLRRLGQTPVPAHAIAGIAPESPETERFFDFLIHWSGNDTTVDAILGGEGEHDTIVPRQSQLAGLSASSSLTVPNVVHASAYQQDVGETDAVPILRQISRALIADTRSGPTFGTFGSLAPGPAPAAPPTCKPPAGASSTPVFPGTAVLVPAAGTVVHPGDKLTVSLSISGGEPVNGAVFRVGESLTLIQAPNVLATTIQVPAARAGRIDIRADTFGPGPSNHSASSWVTVQPSTSVQSLHSPRHVSLDRRGQRFQLGVMGSLAFDGEINVSSATAGTTYRVASGGSQVITVSPDGLVEAAGAGRDEVVISHAGLQTATMFTVATGSDAAALRIAAHPQGTTVVAGGTATLSVSAYGTGVLSYQWYRGVNPDDSNPIAGAMTATYSTGPLPTGTLSYWVRVTDAQSSLGSRTATLVVKPLTVPNAPTIERVTAGNAAVSVAFRAPPDDGGSAITGYTVRCGGQSISGPNSPLTVTGLANGTPVTCTVIATNALGDSVASAASSSVTPVTIPTVVLPSSTGITGTGATLSGNVTSDGGAPITERGILYSLTATNANPMTGGNGVTKSTVSGVAGLFASAVTGLTPLSGYSYRAFATNSQGIGYSAVALFTTVAGVPGAPTIGTATGGNGTVSVVFTVPSDNGGSPITGYTATCGAQSGTGTSSPITVNGLTNGTAVTCTVVATNSVGNSAASSPSNSVTPNFTGTSIPRLVNISTRGLVETGDNIMIGGFIVGGSDSKRVVIRGRGPSMAPLGVPGTLVDPAIRLFSGATPIAFNDDWPGAPNAAEITASGQAPSHGLESAILTTVSPGVPYTVHLTGVAETIGIAIVEVFELDKPEIPLLNISTRGQVQGGDRVLIGGFIIQGDAPQQVLILAKGPSLGQAPFSLQGALPDPTLDLYQAGVAGPIESNDNWVDSPNMAAIQGSGNAPSSPLESGIIRTLPPGAYTAIVQGKGALGRGIGLVEVYKK